MSGASTIIAAKAGAARRAVVSHFSAAEAFSSERATSFTPSGGMERGAFERLLRRGAIREASPGSYYLDRAKLAAADKRRWTLLAGLGAVAAAMFALG